MLLSPRDGEEVSDRAKGRSMILRAIRTGMFNRPGHNVHGGWRLSVDADVSQNTLPTDRNMAGFNGSPMSLLRVHDPECFSDWPDDERKEFEAALHASARFAFRHPVRIGYTNPQFLDLHLGFVIGADVDDKTLLASARRHLYDLVAFTATCDSVEEFCSPTYMAVNLNGLVPLAEFLDGTKDGRTVQALLADIWGMIAVAVHGPTAEVSFPHCRAYSDTAREEVSCLYAWLNLVCPDLFPICDDEARAFLGLALPGLYAPLRVPPAVVQSFRDLITAPVQTRELVEWIGRCGWHPPFDLSEPGGSAPRFRIATRYKTKSYCIGSVNEIDGWLQRRACGAYWNDNAGKTTGFKFHVLVDYEPPGEWHDGSADPKLIDWPFMQAVEFVSLQDEDRVIGAMKTATILPAAPGDSLGTPADVWHGTGRPSLAPVDPVAWLVGTHWRQPIERPLRWQHLKRLAVRIAAIGAGQFETVDADETKWLFKENGVEAVFELPNGAALVLDRANTRVDRQVPSLDLLTLHDIEWDWLNPPEIFVPFGVRVREQGAQRDFGLEHSGNSQGFTVSIGNPMQLAWKSTSSPNAIEQRTWFGTVNGTDILPNGYRS
jgi:hypothetical protein